MFTLNHFIWLGICVVFIVTLTIISIKFKFSFKTATLVICLISIASEVCKIFTHIDDPFGVYSDSHGGVLGAGFLPFHLCSILIFTFFYLYLSKNEERKEKLKTFIVPVCYIGGILALFIPTSGVNFLAPYAYQCFIYHSGIVWYAIYLSVTKQVKLGLKEYLIDGAYLLGLVFAMLWVNSILQVYDTNFFYVVRPPMDNLPILNLNHGWLAYFLTLIGAGLILTLFVHLPSIIKDIKNKK